jgi:hypothetical protein
MIPQHGTRGQKPIAFADNGRLGAVKFWLTKSSQHQFNRDGTGAGREPAVAREAVRRHKTSEETTIVRSSRSVAFPQAE